MSTAATVVKFDGALDIFSRQETLGQLEALREHPRAIVDLREVTAVDGAFLGQIATLGRAKNEEGGTLVLVVSNPLIRRVLEMVRFDEVFPIVDSLEQAQALTATA